MDDDESVKSPIKLTNLLFAALAIVAFFAILAWLPQNLDSSAGKLPNLSRRKSRRNSITMRRKNGWYNTVLMFSIRPSPQNSDSMTGPPRSCWVARRRRERLGLGTDRRSEAGIRV